MAAMDWNIIGHRWAVALLCRQMERGSLHHAYLITGPEGVGRRALAMSFAGALLCERPPAAGATCGACRACRQVPLATYPDLHVVQRLEDRQGIAIEQVRELQRQLSLTSLAGGRRVALIADIDRASLGAANALLKTLEEPPPRVVLILTGVDAEEIPATIVSRCEKLNLRPVAGAEIASALERRGARPAEASEWARLSAGRPAWGVAMMDDPTIRRRQEEHSAALREVLAANLERRFVLAEMWKDDADLEERLSVWLSLANDALRSGESLGAKPGGAAGAPDRSAGRAIVQSIVRTLEGLRHNVNVRLALELLMLELPRST